MSDEAVIYPFQKTVNKKSAEKKKFIARVLWVVIFVLIFFIILELVFHLLLFPNMQIKYIEVTGEPALSNENLLSIAGLQDKEYYFSIDINSIKRRLESVPLVLSARVEKVFPDTIRINIKKRIPLLMAMTCEGDKTVPAVFDVNGVLFMTGEEIKEWNLPVVSGLVFKPQPGLVMPQLLEGFLEDINRIKTESPVLLSMISEIRIISKNEASFELILYPLNHQVRMYMGSSLDIPLLKYAFMVIDALNNEGIMHNIEELDFRTGEVVYKLKED